MISPQSKRTAFSGKGEFTYDAERDVSTCPQAETLRLPKNTCTENVRVDRADAATGNGCPRKEKCTPSSQGRQVRRDVDWVSMERVRDYHHTEPW